MYACQLLKCLRNSDSVRVEDKEMVELTERKKISILGQSCKWGGGGVFS
jgi:hypothetical protein